ncbi:MAG: primosomal protein N' [Bryobacteraceae bacterium]|nr:primosomal protein N' [Bryobacteraceae bacterium]
MELRQYEYCDVSLPVPLDRPFTYRLPLTLRHRVRPGCRLTVPFGARKLTGVVLACHNAPPPVEIRQALRLLDEEPVLDDALLALARWVATYYSAPLGEVLRAMTPLAGEMHRSKVYSLTDAGRDAARQLLLGASSEEPAVELMRMLEARPLTESWLKSRVPGAQTALKSLLRKGFIEMDDVEAERDPLRAASARLRVEFSGRPADVKLKKAERELAAYLELHPGAHNLGELETKVANAGVAARAMARRGLLALRPEGPAYRQEHVRPPHVLNADQQKALEELESAIRASRFQTFLLQGVTGSGKTEVYLRAIEAALALERSALLLVPEIALTPAVAGQFYHRFGDRVAILHSAFSDRERAEQWRRIRSGGAWVVVGTRSGVFAPVRNLGLIVVDEEHDQSYKQEETPRYNGRDVAIVRAQQAGACVVLGSATPSMESRHNAEKSRYKLLSLPERIEKRPLPQVELIDMRQEFLETRRQSTFSRRMLEAIAARLESGEQTMLLLNRRGFSSFVACRTCGERIECRNCAVTLTHHRRDRRMLCHYCNYAERVPSKCPKCDSEYIYFIGQGSEKVEEELHRAFPEARVARMDRDTVTSKRHYESILFGFRAREYDILVGTQMIAKGHDIPNVTLVGVVSADVGLGMPDFRAAERTFQLLTQAAGRAGRGERPGIVLVQTINPDHYAVRFSAAQNYEGFYAKELHFRRMMRYPPFSALANVLVQAENREEALRMSADLERRLNPAPAELKVIGPAEAPVPRLKREYRYQMLIKSASRKALRETLEDLRRYALDQKWNATALVIDVDPLSLM